MKGLTPKSRIRSQLRRALVAHKANLPAFRAFGLRGAQGQGAVARPGDGEKT